MHRQRQTGPETPLSQDHKKLQACSRTRESASSSIVFCRLSSFALAVINSYQKFDSSAKLDNCETPKASILMIAIAIDGRYDDPDACFRSVNQY